ncbi:MAG: hypothetical protein J2P30_01545 [Actinobacteria bacterium]|nr:hypothetical protein [Actinomycetota bacterium]
MSLDGFWAGYDATLARVRAEKPATLEDLAGILNAFQPPSAGAAFFGNNADDQLALALRDAGWYVHWLEGDYLWEAHRPGPGGSTVWIHYVEGDVYGGPYRAAPT